MNPSNTAIQAGITQAVLAVVENAANTPRLLMVINRFLERFDLWVVGGKDDRLQVISLTKNEVFFEHDDVLRCVEFAFDKIADQVGAPKKD